MAPGKRDLDIQQRQWLTEKLKWNRISALVAILLVIAIAAWHGWQTWEDGGRVGGIWGMAAGPDVWVILAAVCAAVLEIFLWLRFGKPDAKHRKYGYLYFVKPPDNLLHELRLEWKASPARYPLYGLLAEAFILATICAVSGGSGSPYFALFIYFSALAEVVLDRFAARASFVVAFIAMMMWVIVWPINAISVYEPSMPSMVIIAIASLMITGYVVSCVVQLHESEMERVSKQLDTIGKAWRTQGLAASAGPGFDGYAYVVASNGGSTLDAKTTLALLPYCLRSMGCPYRGGQQSRETNTRCKMVDGDQCDRSEECDGGSAASVLKNRNIPFLFVGHGHGIIDALKASPHVKTVLGVSCVRSFAEEGEKLLRSENVNVNRLVFYPLAGGFHECPSFLGFSAEESAKMLIKTTLDRPTFASFVQKAFGES